MADEFSPELADGMAYVAGHDDEQRPVMVNFFFTFLLSYFQKKLFLFYHQKRNLQSSHVDACILCENFFYSLENMYKFR